MESFSDTIKRICDVDEKALIELTHKAKTFNKGDLLLKADEVCKNYYFIQTGIVKLFFDNGNRNFIMTFFRECHFFTELSSYNTGRSSKYMLAAVEPAKVIFLRKTDIDFLSKQHHSIETLFRRLNETATVKMMDRIGEMLEDDAKKRYASFLKQNSHLIQRISLGDLADYIGITQVSLSRIRGQK